jgi:F0F1-type ATP synthase beta subunit
MNPMKIESLIELADFKKFISREIAEAFVFPLIEPLTASEKIEDAAFWQEQRKHFENRTYQQKAYDKMLQLKFNKKSTNFK